MRGRWAARGKGSWKYWVKILMEGSQSPWHCSQQLMLMFPKLHLCNTDVFYLCREKVDWAFISCCFSAPPRVLHRHSRKVKDNHSSLLLHTKQLLLTPWELRVLLKDMLMTIHEGFSLICPSLVTCYCRITLNQHLTLQVGRWPYALLLLVDPLVAFLESNTEIWEEVAYLYLSKVAMPQYRKTL